MRAVAVHTVPVWSVGGVPVLPMEEEIAPGPPPLLGWANVLILELDGERRQLLLV